MGLDILPSCIFRQTSAKHRGRTGQDTILATMYPAQFNARSLNLDAAVRSGMRGGGRWTGPRSLAKFGPSPRLRLVSVLPAVHRAWPRLLKTPGSAACYSSFAAATNAMAIDIVIPNVGWNGIPGSLSATLLAIVLYLLGSYLSNPLRRYPGPFFASKADWHPAHLLQLTALEFTNLWRLYNVHQGSFHLVVDRLHKKYGPVVRIGPNVIDVDYPELIKTVFNTKGDWKKVLVSALSRKATWTDPDRPNPFAPAALWSRGTSSTTYSARSMLRSMQQRKSPSPSTTPPTASLPSNRISIRSLRSSARSSRSASCPGSPSTSASGSTTVRIVPPSPSTTPLTSPRHLGCRRQRHLQ